MRSTEHGKNKNTACNRCRVKVEDSEVTSPVDRAALVDVGEVIVGKSKAFKHTATKQVTYLVDARATLHMRDAVLGGQRRIDENAFGHVC